MYKIGRPEQIAKEMKENNNDPRRHADAGRCDAKPQAFNKRNRIFFLKEVME